MLLFGSKISVNPDNEDVKVLNLDTQKGMLKALSNQEKLLLVELQRTRKQIVEELDKINVKSGSMEDDVLKETLKNYISSQDTNSFHTGVTQKFKPLTTGKPMTVKIGVDMIPSLASTGEAAFEVGINYGKGPRLPVFKLPALPPVAPPPSSANRRTRTPTDGLRKDVVVVSSKGQGQKQSLFIRYPNHQMFLENASTLSSQMSSRNKYFICQYLGINEDDIDLIEQEMYIRYNDSIQDPNKYKLETVFMITHELRAVEEARALERQQQQQMVAAAADRSNSRAGGRRGSSSTASVSKASHSFMGSTAPGALSSMALLNSSSTSNLHHSSLALSSTVGAPLGSGVASMSFTGSLLMSQLREDILAKSMEGNRPSTTKQNNNSRTGRSQAKYGQVKRHDKLSPLKSLENALLSKLSAANGGQVDSAAVLKVDLLRSLRSMQTHTTKVRIVVISFGIIR
jgi:hypothetical protein